MRIPVYPCGSNPEIDPPILRKSVSYCQRQVADLLAKWVEPAAPARGIIAQQLLPRENTPIFLPEPAHAVLPQVELDGLKFDDPEKDKAKLANRALLIQRARTVAYFGADKDLTRLGAEEA